MLQTVRASEELAPKTDPSPIKARKKAVRMAHIEDPGGGLPAGDSEGGAEAFAFHRGRAASDMAGGQGRSASALQGDGLKRSGHNGTAGRRYGSGSRVDDITGGSPGGAPGTGGALLATPISRRQHRSHEVQSLTFTPPPTHTNHGCCALALAGAGAGAGRLRRHRPRQQQQLPRGGDLLQPARVQVHHPYELSAPQR